VKTIIEPSREIPVVRECDVLVVGGGPAGLAASVAAARLGARVVLVERYGYLGGLATGGLVIWLPGFRPGGSDVYGGLALEWVQRVERAGGTAYRDLSETEQAVLADPELLKSAALDIVVGAQVDTVFHAWATASVAADGRVQGIVIESKSGRQAILASATVDATGDADVDRARSMMQTMRDMMGTVVGNGRMEGTAIVTALNLTREAGHAQVSAAEAFGKRFEIMMRMIDRLYDHGPGEYRLVGDPYGHDELQYVGASANNKTWKVTSQVEGPSNGLVLTVTVDNVMEAFHFDPAAGKYQITATKSGVNYSATLTPTINETNHTAQLTASINLQDSALSQPITFNGTLQLTLASMDMSSGPRATSATFNGSFSSQFGSAQVNNLRVDFDPDSSQEDSLQRIRLTSLQAQIAARPLSLSLQGVDVPFMKLQGGGTAPTSITVNTLQVTGRDESNKQISLTISQVSGTFEEYRDPVNGVGSGVIKTLSGRMNFASERLTLSGEISGTWDNPVPFGQISQAGHRLSTYPKGTIRINGNMTPSIGKPAAVDITIATRPDASPPKGTVSATFTYGAESMQASMEMLLEANEVDGVYPASATFTMTHSPSGMKVEIAGERNQPPIGTIKNASGTKIADIGKARDLGVPDLGDAAIVKYRDGTFETLHSLLP